MFIILCPEVLEQFFQQRAVLIRMEFPSTAAAPMDWSADSSGKGGPADPQTAGQILPGPGSLYHALLILLLQEMGNEPASAGLHRKQLDAPEQNWTFQLHRAA